MRVFDININQASLATPFAIRDKEMAILRVYKHGSLPRCRVDSPMIDHLRDVAPNLEKYTAVQIFSHVRR